MFLEYLENEKTQSTYEWIVHEWIIGINVKHKTIKFLEDNVGEYVDNLEFGNDILETTPKAWSIKEIIDVRFH